jgi:hypothetical protein
MLNDQYWSLVYNPYIEDCFTPAGRAWMVAWPLYTWGWDENFGAMIASVNNREYALASIKLSYRDNRNGPLAVWKFYKRFLDKELLKFVYPFYRQMYSDGELILGKLGKGMDDTPMRSFRQEQYPIDGNSYKALNLKLFSLIAGELGLEEDRGRFEAQYDFLKAKINETLWNEAEKRYFSRAVSSGEWNQIDTPVNFYPLLAGVVPENRKQDLTASILDPDQFGGRYILPTVSRRSEHYGYVAKPGEEWNGYPMYNYWRGTVWPMSSYLVYAGLIHSGCYQTAHEVAARSTAMWGDIWDKYQISAEMFNPETGEPGNMSFARHQVFSGLMPLMSLEELIDVDIWGRNESLKFGGYYDNEETTLNNIHLFRSKYDIAISQKQFELRKDGVVVFASRYVPVIRDFIMTDNEFSFHVINPRAENNQIRMSRFNQEILLEQGSYWVEGDAENVNVSLMPEDKIKVTNHK